MIAKEQRVKEARRADKRKVVGILAFMAAALGYGANQPATVRLQLGDGDWKASATFPKGYVRPGFTRKAGRFRASCGKLLRVGKPPVHLDMHPGLVGRVA